MNPFLSALKNALISFRGADTGKLDARRVDARGLSTEQWASVERAVRENAFFSSKVSDAKLLGRMQGYISRAAKGENGFGKSDFIKTMRRALGAEKEAPGRSGALTDIKSTKRLGLIYDFQREKMMGEIFAEQSKDPDVLEQFPAYELVRERRSRVPRDWETRWLRAGGKFHAGKMVALRTDPVWRKLSRFGNPYPPFDFNSGMGLEEVSRSDAIKYGLVKESAGDRNRNRENGDNVVYRETVSPYETPYLKAVPAEKMLPDFTGVNTSKDAETWIEKNIKTKADFSKFSPAEAKEVADGFRIAQAIGILDVKNIKMVDRLTNSKSLGTYNRQTKTISISPRPKNAIAQILNPQMNSVAIHEITHAKFDGDVLMNAPQDRKNKLVSLWEQHKQNMSAVEHRRRVAKKRGHTLPKYPMRDKTKDEIDEFVSDAVEDALTHKTPYSLSKQVLMTILKAEKNVH